MSCSGVPSGRFPARWRSRASRWPWPRAGWTAASAGGGSSSWLRRQPITTLAVRSGASSTRSAVDVSERMRGADQPRRGRRPRRRAGRRRPCAGCSTRARAASPAPRARAGYAAAADPPARSRGRRPGPRALRVRQRLRGDAVAAGLVAWGTRGIDERDPRVRVGIAVRPERPRCRRAGADDNEVEQGEPRTRGLLRSEWARWSGHPCESAKMPDAAARRRGRRRMQPSAGRPGA